jgi:hypothetical protein
MLYLKRSIVPEKLIGKDTDVYFTSSVKTMADIWMGDNTYKKAIRDGSMKIVGEKSLTRNRTLYKTRILFI